MLNIDTITTIERIWKKRVTAISESIFPQQTINYYWTFALSLVFDTPKQQIKVIKKNLFKRNNPTKELF